MQNCKKKQLYLIIFIAAIVWSSLKNFACHNIISIFRYEKEKYPSNYLVGQLKNGSLEVFDLFVQFEETYDNV